MNRIRPADLESAYLKNGFGICFNHWRNDNSGCALTHLYVATKRHQDIFLTSVPNLFNLIYEWATEKYSQAYIYGFLCGFDNNWYGLKDFRKQTIFLGGTLTQSVVGYTDGANCRKWCLGQIENKERECQA